jgi:hypothetical protein
MEFWRQNIVWGHFQASAVLKECKREQGVLSHRCEKTTELYCNFAAALGYVQGPAVFMQA